MVVCCWCNRRDLTYSSVRALQVRARWITRSTCDSTQLAPSLCVNECVRLYEKFCAIVFGLGFMVRWAFIFGATNNIYEVCFCCCTYLVWCERSIAGLWLAFRNCGVCKAIGRQRSRKWMRCWRIENMAEWSMMSDGQLWMWQNIWSPQFSGLLCLWMSIGHTARVHYWWLFALGAFSQWHCQEVWKLGLVWMLIWMSVVCMLLKCADVKVDLR